MAPHPKRGFKTWWVKLWYSHSNKWFNITNQGKEMVQYKKNRKGNVTGFNINISIIMKYVMYAE